MIKKEICRPGILNSSKISFTKEGDTKAFLDKTRDLITMRPELQEICKEDLQAERK